MTGLGFSRIFRDMQEQRGFVHVYTGDGKGKTSAALGLALRALGHGFWVWLGRFLKDEESGEVYALRRFAGEVKVESFGSGRFLLPEEVTDEDRQAAEEGLSRAKEILLSQRYRVVILDEVITAVGLGVIPEGAVLELISQRPDPVELILTGRGASQRLKDAADLVSEIRAEKHYFDRGIEARPGIEW